MTEDQQWIPTAARSSRVGKSKTRVGVLSCQADLATGVSFSLSAGQAGSEQRKPCRISPCAHIHTHTHTLNATVLQFPELLNHVIMSLSLSLPCLLTAPLLSFPSPHSRASLVLPLLKKKQKKIHTLFGSYPLAPTL